MANRKRIDIGPSIAKTRGQRPALLAGPRGPMGLRYLQPKAKTASGRPIHSPVYVWACRTPTGWHGWLEDQRQANRKAGTITAPIDGWSHDMWEETNDPAGKALPPGKEMADEQRAAPKRKAARR